MNLKGAKNSNGCLWVFVVFVFTIVAFGVSKFFLGLPDVITLLISLVLSVVLSNYLLGKPTVKSLLVNFVLITVIIGGLRFLGTFLNEFLVIEPGPTFSEKEIVATDSIIENNDTIPVFTANRKWKDHYGNPYTGKLTVRQKDYSRLKNHISSYTPNNRKNYWGELYKTMATKDGPSLDLIFTMFQEIHASKQLNQMEFAEMVVSCIQDIPYSFVFQDACLAPERYEDSSIKNILEDCPECCIGNIPFGIQNPVSFIANLKGDCDTRTVLIYTILSQFDYDVAIANSDFYRHSIVGLNIPATGKQKKHKGKTYTLWETTSKYFKIGTLSPSQDDTTHWNIVLTSK